jgi:branched-chain amino acid transport system ATP-binding protein
MTALAENPPPRAEDGVLLRTESLGHRYGKFTAVDDVSISIRAGEIKALIGPNGAGKTTLINLLSGQVSPTNGRIFYKGRDMTGLRSNDFARRGIGRSFQITSIFPGIPVIENIRIAAQVSRARDFDFVRHVDGLTATRERAEALLDYMGLGQYGTDFAGTLSHGDQRRLEIAIVLATDPEVVLLDEPAAGMSQKDAEEFSEILIEIAKERTVFFIEHNIDFVMKIAHRIAVMRGGNLLAEGTPSEIRENDEVRRAYLGSLHG